jgi:enoyl-CoA hydratase
MGLLINNEDGIVTITINRPEALNAINKEVMEGLGQFFTDHQDDYNIKGVIITGAGEKAFVAGADIKQFSGLNALEGEALSKFGQDVYFKIENFHKPVIAAVNGFALGGGCELALACHMRVASNKAKFGQPEVNLGLLPGYGGTQRLAHCIGKSKAFELLLTADMIDAIEAKSLGLINHVVDAGQEIEKSKEIINKIATKGPLAVKYTIQCINDCYDESKNGFKTEYEAFGTLLTTDDAKEGAAAFIEKRKANFTGK